jgi:thiamine-monophosphate kinase
MRETELIALIRRLNERPAPGLVAGIGDDCAILRPRAGEDLLVTTDLLLEGVHFERATHTGVDCGWKCLARGLSDIAAMGGTPRYAFVSLGLPEWACGHWVRDFYRGMGQLAARYGIVVAGGDLTKSDKALCDIVVLGAVRRGKALRRGGAHVGDRLFVTGALGGSAFGLETKKGKAWQRHRRPEPRIEAGQLLARKLGATACMDVSDGLALDLHRLCMESGCAAELNGTLPLFPGASVEQALSGGEDYELLFAAPPTRRIPPQIAGLDVTEIGVCVAGKPGALTRAGKPLAAAGWDPFAAPQRARGADATMPVTDRKRGDACKVTRT